MKRNKWVQQALNEGLDEERINHLIKLGAKQAPDKGEILCVRDFLFHKRAGFDLETAYKKACKPW